MKTKSVFALLSATVTVVGTLAIFRLSGASPKPIDPLPTAEIEASFEADGRKLHIVRGDAYEVDSGTGKWKLLVHLYDTDYREKNYVERDGVIFRKGDSGELFPVKRTFTEDFENLPTVRDLIGIKRGWTTFTLQSPETPDVPAYNALRKRILNQQGDFLDNRVEPTTERTHGGQGALKTVSVEGTRSMITAKASLSTELMHFVKGDDVWYSAWYYVPEGSPLPSTWMDLETTWMHLHPGIRIMTTGGGKYLCVELKWAQKPVYRQQKGKEVLFPTGRWVHVKAHFKLSEKEDGIIELWQDDQKIVDARGQTLVLSHAIYNSLEVGISAYSEQRGTCTLFVDDVRLSNLPPH